MFTKVISSLGKKETTSYEITWKVFNGEQCELTKELKQKEKNASFVPRAEPSPRTGHSSFVCGSLMLVFGGINADAKYLSDLYAFDFISKSWTCLKPPEIKQNNADDSKRKTGIARTNHASIVWLDGGTYRMLVFGGKSKLMKNDLIEIDSDKLEWTRLESDTKDPNKPSLRMGHTAVYHLWNGNNTMWVFGGFDSLGLACNDLFVYNIDSKLWKKIDWKEGVKGTEERVPSRYFHTAVVHANAIWIFGGQGDKGALSDIIKFDLATMAWRTIETKNSPSPRWAHAACVDTTEGLMVIHGGTDGNTVFSDTWLFHFEHKTWQQAKEKNSKALFHHSMCFHANELFIFGGKNGKYVSSELVVGSDKKRIAPIVSGYQNLPSEIALQIFSQLQPAELCAVAMTCSRWKQISESSWIWDELNKQYCEKFNQYSGVSNFLSKDSSFGMLPSKSKLIKIHNMIHGHNKKLRQKFQTDTGLHNVKLLAIGPHFVGKTTFLYAMAYDQDKPDWSNFFEGATTNEFLDGVPCQISYWDTAGQEDYDRLRPLSYPDTDVFILMYSVTQPETFREALEKFIPEVEHYVPGTPIIVLANKVDLVKDESWIAQNKPFVNEEEAKKAFFEMGVVQYFSGSCKLRDVIPQVKEAALKVGLFGAQKASKKPKCPIQ